MSEARTVDVAAARPRIRPMRWVAGAVMLVLAAQLGWFLYSNPRFEWPVVGQYLFDPNVLRGLGMTILLAVIAMTLGSTFGVLLALGRLSEFRPLSWTCSVYIGVFRGVPPLVQLVFWYNLGYLLPQISLGIPFGPTFASWPTNTVISSFTAAIIGLTLHEAAYMAEIVRAGILGVDGGQKDAARAVGFTARQSFVKVVLPQAMRVIIPPAGSQFISLVKGTSLVSVIAMADLFYSVTAIYSQSYQIVPLLIVACFWYLVVVTLLSIGQQRLERHFGKGQR